MNGTTYQATIRNGRIVLDEPVDLPEMTIVYLVVPDAESTAPVRLRSPRLARIEDVDLLRKEVSEEPTDAGL